MGCVALLMILLGGLSVFGEPGSGRLTSGVLLKVASGGFHVGGVVRLLFFERHGVPSCLRLFVAFAAAHGPFVSTEAAFAFDADVPVVVIFSRPPREISFRVNGEQSYWRQRLEGHLSCWLKFCARRRLSSDVRQTCIFLARSYNSGWINFFGEHSLMKLCPDPSTRRTKPSSMPHKSAVTLLVWKWWTRMARLFARLSCRQTNPGSTTARRWFFRCLHKSALTVAAVHVTDWGFGAWGMGGGARARWLGGVRGSGGRCCTGDWVGRC